jgi:predicted lactoylglutathione lyase
MTMEIRNESWKRSRAAAAGGRINPSPKDDYGWMYGRSFEDLDGHMWGVNWMDLEAAKAARFETAKA